LPLADTTRAEDGRIPQKPTSRIIVDNDFAGDPDGLAALAHQLLTPKTTTVLVTSSALNPSLSENPEQPTSARRGRDLAKEVVDRLSMGGGIRVVAGPEAHGINQPASEAARAIVDEAMRDDPLPLFFTCGGPLTNLAAALKLEPAIADRMTVIWIGGGAYPDGGWEYNLATDLESARGVIEGSNVPVWQVPLDTYRQMQYSVAEMTTNLRPISPFSQWLYSKYTTPPDFVTMGGSLTMGDHPLVLLTALGTESSRYSNNPARRILNDFRYGPVIPDRSIRVYEQVDARLAFADFLALLRLHSQ
jgi:Inosine-uridine preferring nucleoside hydrolase